MNNSQFWSWVDHWEGWDYMSDEQEDKMLLEDWDEELFCELDPCISERDLRLIMICLECGNALDCCICEDAVPTPPPIREPSAPLPVSLISRESRFYVFSSIRMRPVVIIQTHALTSGLSLAIFPARVPASLGSRIGAAASIAFIASW